MRKPKRNTRPALPPESHPIVYRVDFDGEGEPVIEKLLVTEGKECYRLKTEAGQVVYDAAYLSVRVQRTLGSTPREALQTTIEALASSAAQAQAVLRTLERQLERARAKLSKLSGGSSET